MNRLWVFCGAAAIVAMLPCVTLGAPTGGTVYRAAPVVVRPVSPQRTAGQSQDDFKLPMHIDAAPKARMPDTMRAPAPQWITRPQWTWHPNYAYLNGPCFANGANFAPLQNLESSQSSLPDVKIGSLAGDPKHSILGTSPSDIANLASSSATTGASPGSTGLQIEFQPSLCGQQW